MHLSLKGSMDRQPLTDRLGDRLLAEYGGAAAAYSLRALNGNGDNVVRVRRASDNNEKDFTAEQIELGEMVNWVNSQTVPPLDIGVETSEGRIPVPEGGTSIGTPAAAYSLRNLSSTYTGNVVDVRRSSDDAVESFTAAEVADGTLEDWVTEEQVGWNLQPTWDVSSSDGVISSQSSTATTSTFSITTTSGDSFVRQSSKPNHVIASSGDQVVANITLSGFNSAFNAKLRTSGTNTNVASQTLTNGTADYTFNLAGSAGYFAFTGVEATSGGTLTINSIKVIGKSGFVTKWYDQSGNDNHATQGTAAKQPKIVEGGSLLDDGISFDGDFFLQKTTADSTVSASIFGVQTKGTSSNNTARPIGYQEESTGGTNSLTFAMDNTIRFDGDASTAGSVTIPTSGLFLASTIKVSNTEANNFINGSSSIADSGLTLDDTDVRFTLGFATTTPDYSYDGSIKEAIFYNSDQSANREAIEANIGEYYGITGIPAYDNTVDGFVETWYDQSGNGNDATQTVAASQPKIVDAGVLVSGGIDFDGVDDQLTTSSFISGSNFSAFSVLKCTDISSNENQSWNFTDNASEFYGLTFNRNAAGNVAFASTTPESDLGEESYTGNKKLFSTFSGTSNSYYSNGTESVLVKLGRHSPSTGNTIGSQGTSGRYLEGSIEEIIVYNSDQSANRTAIEANINNHYSIY